MSKADLRDRAFTARDFTSNWKRLHELQTVPIDNFLKDVNNGRTVKECLEEIYGENIDDKYHCTYCNTLLSTFDKNCRNCGSSIKEQP